ncbi:MAG: flagellar assembly protein FliX [Rickettsiaceae bacterium]|nr:flagellar assembly protein FliX [Rickettsiaceae bacterium]
MTIQGILGKIATMLDNKRIERKVNSERNFRVEAKKTKEEQYGITGKVHLLDNVNLFAMSEILSHSEELEILKRKSKNALRKLHLIRIALLEGAITESLLKDLEVTAKEELVFTSQDHMELYQEIRLRVEVELAKLEKMKGV